MIHLSSKAVFGHDSPVIHRSNLIPPPSSQCSCLIKKYLIWWFLATVWTKIKYFVTHDERMWTNTMSQSAQKTYHTRWYLCYACERYTLTLVAWFVVTIILTKVLRIWTMFHKLFLFLSRNHIAWRNVHVDFDIFEAIDAKYDERIPHLFPKNRNPDFF